MWGKGPLLASGEQGLRIDPARLHESYRRCEEAGVPRDLETLHPVTDPNGVDLRVQRPALLDFARTLFRDAADFIVGRRPLFLVTDAQARVALAVSSDEHAGQAAEQAGLAVGSSLAEEDIGTTASGLALRFAGPAVVCGDEHFCRVFHDWFCAAVPVGDGNGGLLGSLIVSTQGSCDIGEKLALAYSLSRALTEFDRASLRGATSNLLVQLTERQQQVLKLFAEGLSYKQIAKQLNVTSRKTIEDHLDAIRAKLGAGSRRECIRRAIELGLL